MLLPTSFKIQKVKSGCNTDLEKEGTFPKKAYLRQNSRTEHQNLVHNWKGISCPKHRLEFKIRS